MSNAIEINQLTKRYGDAPAVNEIALQVEAGEIYGLLGPNDAGKTTIIRAMLGMIRPSAGNVKLLGQVVGPKRPGTGAQVGHLDEKPSAHPTLTVRQNLHIARRFYRRPASAVDAVIEQMSLASCADRRAGSLSSGSFQRFRLARTLSHEPSLLILDEPMNGLDPTGVIEVRTLLRTLARDKGTTIFMSSRYPAEVDHLATRIGIIHKGRLIEELDSQKLERLRTKRLEVQTHNLEAAQLCLQSAGIKFALRNETIILSDSHAIEHPDYIAHILVNAGTSPVHLAVVQQNLEEYFLKLTGQS